MEGKESCLEQTLCSHPLSLALSYDNKKYCKVCGSYIPQKLNVTTLRSPRWMKFTTTAPGQLIFNMNEEYKITPRNPNSKATYISIRNDLYDQILKISTKFKISTLVRFLAIEFMDRIMSSVEFPKTRTPLVAACCFIIAAKFEELDERIPFIEDVKESGKFMFPFKDFKQCELFLLKILNWNLKMLTPYHYVELLLAQGIVFSNDKIKGQPLSEIQVKDIENNIIRILEDSSRGSKKCLMKIYVDYKLFSQSPITIAMASVYEARKMLLLEPAWNPILTEMTSLSIKDIEPSFRILHRKREPKVSNHLRPTTQLINQINKTQKIKKKDSIQNKVYPNNQLGTLSKSKTNKENFKH